MALNIAGLKKQQASLERGSGGKDGYLNQKDLTEETIVKLLPPVPSMDGLPYVIVKRWWIDKNPYISAATFGGRDLIQENLDKALASDDEDLKILANDKKRIVLKDEYWFPLLLLKEIMNDKGQVKGVEIVDNKCKILPAGTQLTQQILDVMTSRAFSNSASKDGICDRVTGASLILSRKGSGVNTEYKAFGLAPQEIPAKYYASVPDPVQLAKDQIKNNSYVDAVIKKFLYGTAIPDAIEAKEKARVDAVKERYKSNATTSPAATDTAVTGTATARNMEKLKRPAPPVEEHNDPAFKKKAAAGARPPVKKKATVVDDLEDEDPITEQFGPAPTTRKKAPTAPARNIVQDSLDAASDDDDLDEEFDEDLNNLDDDSDDAGSDDLDDEFEDDLD